jgi:hypothetical protein
MQSPAVWQDSRAKSQTPGKSNTDYADTALDGQARKLRRIFSFARKTARTIATLAGAMNHIVKSICCQLETITQAARDKHNAWGVWMLAHLSAKDLYEIWFAAREMCEALNAALERAEDEERLRDHCGPKGGAA